MSTVHFNVPPPDDGVDPAAKQNGSLEHSRMCQQPRSLASSRYSSVASIREAYVAVESEDEGALSGGFKFSWRRLLLHMGPGFLMAIGYIDPGNLESDLQAGAHTGYSLLWVLLWSTAMGYLLQALAAKLGVASGKHLAEQCRQHYPPVVRMVLWIMAELAIIGSDIQEVIGTAIALRLLSGGVLPLYHGVVIAAVSAYICLFLERLGIRHLEAFFQLLIGVMSVSFGYMFFSADIPYGDVAKGLVVPSLSRDTVSVACGILGAVIMPHNLFLHSALVHSRKVHSGRPATKSESVLYYSIEAGAALVVTLFINICVISVFAKGFFGRAASEDIGLENAGQYLATAFGKQMQVVWAVGLLAAGQSSTMTGTYAGQFVMVGFLDLKISAFLRTLVSRAVAICPTLLVALQYRSDSTKMDDLNQWLNILQSVQLPFAVIPLLVLTSDPRVMGWRFCNSLPMSAACWAIAAAIIAINASVAYQAALTHLPRDIWAHIAFWSAVAVYLAFLLYLILSPTRVSAWWARLTGKAGAEAWAGGEEPGALGYYAAGPPGGPQGGPPGGALPGLLEEAAVPTPRSPAAGLGVGLGVGVGEYLLSEEEAAEEALCTPRAVRYRIQGGQIVRVEENGAGAAAAAAATGAGARAGRGAGGRGGAGELREPLLPPAPN